MASDRPLRADARRNALLVIEAARTLFAERGVDIPMEDVGRAAGVGKGTLYRRFPTKDHLIAAVSRDRFDRLTAAAGELAAEFPDPVDALGAWLRDYDRSAQQYRGLRAVESAGIADAGSAIFTDCAPMKERAGVLLAAAQAVGGVRADVEITPLLSLVASLPDAFRAPDGSSLLLPVVLRGIAGVRAG
ncbi:TetR/AcrR family transcriptional regulator [Promicromonospora sp. NPDC057488]|uniref:TetR/AcrR family transcriptional regulator n=1 Tax=Promicromonospora sp. NPDC057488 TaxID=3346147 RepID=UPI0036702086